jgi:hypothetical protein
VASVDPDALDAVLHVLRLSQQALPARWDEDTVDERLTLVGITFYDYVAAVLETPLGDGTPGERVPLATHAAMHARTVADLLTSLALDVARERGEGVPDTVLAEAPQTLTSRWIGEMATVCTEEELRPQHDTAVDYVRDAARWMSLATRILNAERGFSIDPADPRGAVERPDDAATGEQAGALLVACGAAALCIAAILQPQFRISGERRSRG